MHKQSNSQCAMLCDWIAWHVQHRAMHARVELNFSADCDAHSSSCAYTYNVIGNGVVLLICDAPNRKSPCCANHDRIATEWRHFGQPNTCIPNPSWDYTLLSRYRSWASCVHKLQTCHRRQPASPEDGSNCHTSCQYTAQPNVHGS